MRGIPKNPVACKQCTSMTACRKDELCGVCRLRSYKPTKYIWTPEMDAQLRRAYETSGTRRELSKAMRHLAQQLNIPSAAVRWHAGKLGITSDVRKPWTTVENNFLRDHAGEMTASKIARLLKRSYVSVAQQMWRLKFSSRVTAGYTSTDLEGVLGVSWLQVQRWMEKGWLRMGPDKRITERMVLKFLRNHLGAISLKRVDEPWLKGMLCKNFGTELVKTEGRRASA